MFIPAKVRSYRPGNLVSHPTGYPAQAWATTLTLGLLLPFRLSAEVHMRTPLIPSSPPSNTTTTLSTGRWSPFPETVTIRVAEYSKTGGMSEEPAKKIVVDVRCGQ